MDMWVTHGFVVAFAGNYKVEIFDKNINDFVPTVYGLGMHVEIRDPDDKVVLSRVSLAADLLNHGCRLYHTHCDTGHERASQYNSSNV